MTPTLDRQIMATPNESQRTFTLRILYANGDLAKYRTIRMSKDEFNSCIYNTQNDWLQFLKSDDYYQVR
jgi:hypothetical protein